MANPIGQTRGDERTLTCPKCAAAMEKVAFAGVTIDRCEGCRGLWFDAREHERLKNVKGSEQVDVGPASAENRAAAVKLDCPLCHTPMIRMVDHQQPHLWFESCGVCHGVFFDAGEFRDYKEITVGEWFHRWTGGERR